jgi:hypothetical protein
LASRLRALVEGRHLLLHSRRARFERIYRRDHWNRAQPGPSRSGPGSAGWLTEAITAELPRVLARYRVGRLLDAPCGDFHWMSAVSLGAVSYVGVDIVAALIEANRRAYARPGVEFACLDLCRDAWPAADLVLCRDGLVHLSLRDARHALARLQASGASLVLVTTFPEWPYNDDIVTGRWRPLNLQRAPFDWPAPRACLLEGRDPGGRLPPKCLGLWSVADLPPV